MPLAPLSISLTDWQKLEAIKRFRAKYSDELTETEAKLMALLTAAAEADFLAQYLGEQPELKEARGRKDEIEVLTRRRDYLGQLIDRADRIASSAPGGTLPFHQSMRSL